MTQLVVNKNVKSKETFADNHFHNFSRLLMFNQIFLLPRVKRQALITYKHGKYELPHEFSSDLTVWILGNWEILGKCLKFIE